jgi:segregation and condensation protein B
MADERDHSQQPPPEATASAPPDPPDTTAPDLAPQAEPVEDAPAGDEIEAIPGEALPAALEALLFVSNEPVEDSLLARALGVTPRRIARALDALAESLRDAGRGIRVQRGPEGTQLVTAPEAAAHIEQFLGLEASRRLSTAALETLAIVAYRQPVTRGTIEAIRGVSSDASLATLKARGLVAEAGRADTPGRPVLWITTQRFLQHFGLERPADLPALPEDLELPEDDAGVQLALDAEPVREPARDEAEVAADLAALSHAAETALAAHRREAEASSGAEPPSE